MRHHALLASVAVDIGLLDCLLGYPWSWDSTLTCSSRIPAFAGFLSVLVASVGIPEMAQDVLMWQRQIADRSSELWAVLAPMARRKKGFLKDCAGLAYIAPPSVQAVTTLLQCCPAENVLSRSHLPVGSHSLAGLLVFAANAGCTPDQDVLTNELSILDPVSLAQLVAILHGWNGPVRAEALDPWFKFVSAILTPQVPEEAGSASPTSTSLASPPLEATQAASPAEQDDQWHTSGWDAWSAAAQSQMALMEEPDTPAKSTALRDVVSNAPTAFRCALDGKLLVDPVRTPSGHIVERSTLACALDAGGG